MTWLMFATISMLFYAAAEIIGKYLSDPDSEPVYIGFFANLYATVAAGVIAVFSWKLIPAPPPFAIAALLLSGVICAVGTLLYWNALKHLDLSEFIFFTRTQILLVFLGSIIFFREAYAPLQLFGAAAVFIGSVLISFKHGKISISRGAVLAILSSLCFAVEIMIDRAVIGYYTPGFYTVLLYAVITIMLAFPAVKLNFRRKMIHHRKSHSLLLTASILYAASTYLFYNSYSHGGAVAVTSIIMQLQIPLVVMYGIIIFKERGQIIQKVSAALIMVAGAYLIS